MTLIDKNGRQRSGNYMHTANGKKYWPMDPRADEIHIDVIARHLSTQGRWQGATTHRKYRSRIMLSVAEHSVYVARYVREVLKAPQYELEALLHDGPEYVIGDLIRPLKYDDAFREPFKAVEEKNELALAERFGLVYPFPKEVKIADEAVCQAERLQCIILDPEDEWQTGILHDDSTAAPFEIQMLDPYPAYEFFMQAFYDAVARRENFQQLPNDFRVAA